MELNSKKQVKILLAAENMKLKELSEEMSSKTGKKYSPDGLSHKLSRNRLTYDEMLVIAEILNYSIKFEKINL